jgi:branched-chain amino acid transport system substrate-binding protein
MSKPKRHAMVAIAALCSATLLAFGYAALKWRESSPICLAFANSLTGRSSSAGAESLLAIRLYLDEVNRNGGARGHPVKLVLFDDGSSADVARANVQAIADSPCIAVLGHYLSTASLAAGPGYKNARIPALTGTSFVDELTVENPYYFRAQTTSSVQGRSIAEYLRYVLKAPVVHVVYSRDSFGQSFLAGFTLGYDGKQFESWAFDVDPGLRSESVRVMVDNLAKVPEPGIIVIGTGADYIPDVLKAVRRRGIEVLVIAAGGAGSEEFLQNFASEPEEKQHPGFFSQNLYASAPVIFDSAGAAGQAFAASYMQESGRLPGWIAAGAYDAARLMIEALRRVNVENRPDTKEADREHVRAELAKINSRQGAITGLTGSLYFDPNRDMPRPVRLGFFRLGHFVTAPLQLVLVEHPDFIDINDEVRKGHVVPIGSQHYWLQRVVYTGIDINRVNRIDVRQGTFNVDFYLWMRYGGQDDAPTHVEFPALLDRGVFDPVRPLENGREDNLNYRLYRIAGDFKGNYDLHDYPFDIQQLLLRFQNTEQRRELITYVIDIFGLRLTGEPSTAVDDRSAYAGLQLWHFIQLQHFVDSFASGSTLGKQSLFAMNVKTEFAGFNTAIVLRRDSTIFIFKTLLPLFLLVLVVFGTLFFPDNLYRERTTIPVTAILTSAVLLIAVNSQLGDIGYMVAIEVVFYVFFGLCLTAMLAAFMHERLTHRGDMHLAVALDRSTQALYAVTVLAVFALFWWRYGTR